MSKTLDYIALIVVFIGAVNWGLIGLFRLDLVRLIFGDMTVSGCFIGMTGNNVSAVHFAPGHCGVQVRMNMLRMER